MQKRLVIIGAGAAGVFCAVNAAQMDPSLEVIVLEKSNKLLSKVKVSGGGRCNVTHNCFSLADMSKNYPRGGNFIKKAFHQFFTTDTIRWFEERNVSLKAEEDGRMFPVTDSSQTIIDCMLREADRFGVQIRIQQEVKAIRKEATGWLVDIQNREPLYGDYVCIACGGYPKSSSYEWIKALGHSVEEPVPSLFTFNMPNNPITRLMGVSHKPVQVKIEQSKLQQENALLITHWGMSGPAVLKLSAWSARELAGRQYDFSTLVNWIPAYNENTVLEHLQKVRFQSAAQKIGNKNPFGLPQRLWEYLLEEAGISADLRWADLPAKEQNKLVKVLCTQRFPVKGKTTYKEEFVTAGGIRLNEIDPETMGSKLQENLFFAGEIMDVDGVTGGFNFQHAWTSGWIAAKAVAARSGQS